MKRKKSYRIERSSSGYQAPAVMKAFQLLRRVATSDNNLGLSELAEELGFSKSTTHGLIQALLNVRALDHDPTRKKFHLGPALMEIAFEGWDNIRIREHAQPFLDALRDRIGETVFMGGLNRRKGIILATAEALNPLKITAPVGTAIPIMAGAVGKLYLSLQTNEDALAILRENGLKKYTPASIIDETMYMEEVAKVRDQGYATDKEEYLPGVHAVATSIGNYRGLPMAIWVVGFAGSISNGHFPKIVSEVLSTAKHLKIFLLKSQ